MMRNLMKADDQIRTADSNHIRDDYFIRNEFILPMK